MFGRLNRLIFFSPFEVGVPAGGVTVIERHLRRYCALHSLAVFSFGAAVYGGGTARAIRSIRC